MDWSGVEWIGLDWIGVEWSGVEWSGVDWIGVDWSKASDAIDDEQQHHHVQCYKVALRCVSEPLENQEHQLVRNIQQDTTAQASHHHCNDDGFDAARGIGMEMRLPNKPYIVESAIDTNHLDKSMNRHRTDA
jgi:hypothetical protein